MIYKCIALFNLLPTSQPHYWLIAADWLEEENLDITSTAFREGIWNLKISNNNIISFGDGLNYGYYYGCGKGHGNGGGQNICNGHGWGDGFGHSGSIGSNIVFGFGRGSGDGFGDGKGRGR